MDKTFQNIPFLRITIALAIGIIAGTYITVSVIFCLIMLAITLSILFILNLNYKYTFSRFFGTAVNIFFILTGITVTQTFNQKPILIEHGSYKATILETPLEKPNSWKTIAKIDAAFHSDTIHETNETVIVYFAKNDLIKELEAGDVILFYNSPQPIENKNNPYEFDYKKYLEQKRIFRQVYLNSENWKKTNEKNLSLVCRAELMRENLLQIYRKQALDENEFEILSALTLGYKRELDPETKRVFSASGASHVLAVSGLHVGIVFWVISIFFGFMKKYKTGRLFFAVVVISVLWFYAFLTGLSPSVMRASAMFSIFVIGENINRKSNIYNSLSASAFLILLINPNNLFDIGFQLSYAAVFGIVYLQPKIEKIIVVKSKYLKFFWSLITVSFAAQVTTFPLTTYYFGQFPTYFLITNMLVIPAVMILIPLGILMFFTSKIYFITNIFAMSINLFIKLLYSFLVFIDKLPSSVINLQINHFQLLCILGVLISALVFLKNQKIHYLKAAMISILLLSLSNVLISIKRLNYSELIVYNTPKNQAVHLISGRNNFIITEDTLKSEELSFFPGTVTRRKLGLNIPVYLTSNDVFKNENLLFNGDFAVFNGKTISLSKNFYVSEKNKLPDFIINPKYINYKPDEAENTAIIITNKRYLSDTIADFPQIHHTLLKGAFIKKW